MKKNTLIDLSADFRLNKSSDYLKWYKQKHKAIKNIKKDAELTYNYGYPFDSDFEDHICKCGTKKCVGYILSDDDWPKLKKYEEKHKKASR